MKPSIQKLHNYFKLEAQQGYENKAVIGGLERILDHWPAEARADQLPEKLIQAVAVRLRDYQRLTPASRRETLRGIWRRIQRELGAGDLETGEDSPPAPKPEPQQVTAPGETQPEATPVAPAAAQAEAQPTPVAATAAPVITEAPTPSPEEVEELRAALAASVTTLKNVGDKSAKLMEKLGLRTLGDMLYYYPARYDDFSLMKPINRLRYGDKVSLAGMVKSANLRTLHGKKNRLFEAVISDGTGAIRATWFNQPWLAQQIKPGMQVILSGKIDQYLGRLTINSPEWSPVEKQHLEAEGIIPYYRLTADLGQKWLRDKIRQVVLTWASRLPDPLPAAVRRSAGLLDLPTAILQIHYPDSWERLREAQHRLAFDELFLLQLGVLQQKRAWVEEPARPFTVAAEWLQSLKDTLPFALTQAQQRALNDVLRDLASGHPLNRLIQGDVGSGKTVVAALTIAVVAHHGAQAALMAPTSILAEQHYNSLVNILAKEDGPLAPEEIALMVGATPESEKAAIRQRLENGDIKVVVGTHALIEDPVTFHDLQLAVIDEQHRFGVQQRGQLRAKGQNPHLMVMTATPIPRSLALTIYGDLDLSVIDEMPPGRQPVETFVLSPREREWAYNLIRREVENGHQAFIIYPLVEESERSPEKAAVEEHARLQKEVFPRLKVGLMHGRLTPAEKDAVMTQFRNGEFDILVSTSVVEVGVDVPNATVMLIEGAHRFGLAQLHQFRGRVGRGQSKAYCLLIPGSPEKVENERLQAMAETSDGFKLAELDLEQRGPGEFLGTRQSGFSTLRMARLTDLPLIEKARRHAQTLFDQDPDLTQPQHALLAEAVRQFWAVTETDIS